MAKLQEKQGCIIVDLESRFQSLLGREVHTSGIFPLFLSLFKTLVPWKKVAFGQEKNFAMYQCKKCLSGSNRLC